jgi:diguanylate cyclase (GGDEF)-like protein/PAS domain S-box-containing protein
MGRAAPGDRQVEVAMHQELGDFFRLNPIPMWVFDPDSLRFLEVNDAAVARYGYTRDEFQAMTLEQIRPPAERTRLGEAVRPARAAPQRSGPFLHQGRGGPAFAVHIASCPIRYRGLDACIVAAIELSVTAGTNMASAMHPAMLAVGADGVVRFANRSAHALLGVDGAAGEPVDLRTALAQLPWPEVAERVLRAAAGGASERFAVRHPRSGTMFSVSAVATPDGAEVCFAELTEDSLTQQLHDSIERFQLAASACTDVIWDYDLQRRSVWLGGGYAQSFGYPPSDERCSLERWMALIHPDDRPEIEMQLQRLPSSGDDHWHCSYRYRHADGSYRTVAHRARMLRDTGSGIRRIVGAIEDISSRLQADTDRSVWSAVFRALPSAVTVYDARAPQWTIVYVNPAVEQLSGYPAGELLGTDGAFALGDAQDQPGRDAIAVAVAEGRSVSTVLRCRRKDGPVCWIETRMAPVHDRDGALTHYVCIQTDVTGRHLRRAQVGDATSHDPVTALPCRALLEADLRRQIDDHRARGAELSVLLVDIARLRVINEAHGYELGDQVLRESAAAIRKCLHGEEKLYRLAGGEFAVIVADDHGASRGQTLLEILARALRVPVAEPETTLLVTARIGMSRFPQDAATAEALLHSAASAVLRAKAEGVRTAFDDGVAGARRARSAIRLDRIARLHDALCENRLQMLYQPQIDLVRHRVAAVEALARWHDPVHGEIAPAAFVALADDAGMGRRLLRWSLHAACRTAQALRSDGRFAGAVAVNIAPSQTVHPGLRRSIERTLELYQLPPEALELEVTEEALLDDTRAGLAQLNALADLGVSVVLHNFGRGYSSLETLKRLHLRKLKIDRSFIEHIDEDPRDRAIVAAINDVARVAGVRVVAEGVTTHAQVETLLSLGCTQVQGWLYGRARSAEVLARDIERFDRVRAPMSQCAAAATGTQSVSDAALSPAL